MAEAGEQSVKTLPDELVEMILAMVPFPYVFKARVLSKSWLARLSPISSHDDDEKRLLISSFHKQLRQWSTTWKAFCPVSWRGEGLTAYDTTAQSRLRLPSLSFLKKPFLKEDPDGRSGVLAIDGALVVVRQVNKLFVANILTRSSKQLPFHPNPRPRYYPDQQVFLSQTAETYTVILVPHPRAHLHYVHMYDASSDGWTTLIFSPKLLESSIRSSAAYVDGVLYWVAFPNTGQTVLNVVAVNTEDEVRKQFNILPGFGGHGISKMDALVCNTNLLIIIEMEDTGKTVLKIDLRSKNLLMVAPFDHPCHPRCNHMSYVTDDCYLFFAMEVDDRHLLNAYHVRDETYRAVFCSMNLIGDTRYRPVGRWIPSSFRPGLNPFITV